MEEEVEEEEEDYKLIDQMLDSDSPSKLVYNKLIKKKRIIPTKAMDKWRRDLNFKNEDKILIRT